MEEIEKYSFDEWWNGDVILIDSTREIDKNDVQKFAQWNEFSNSDIEKIKQKQFELFTSNVSKLVEQHSEQFKKRFNASQMKSEYLDSEINECKNIMFGKIPNVKIVGLKHWGISLEHQYLTDIQFYINRTIKNGVDDGLGFVHSPNCKHQDYTKPDSRIYAQFVWEYFNWLNSWKNEVKVNLTSESASEEDKIKPRDVSNNDENSNNSSEPKNKYPAVFKNGYAFALFIDLKNLTVKPKTVLADYAFIFHKMKKYGYILSNTKHLSFMDMLRKDFDADISANKLPYKDQEAKKLIFNSLLEKYKPLIESIP